MSVSETITKKSASNLAMAFVLLPKDRAEAMARLYAFCRQVDDVADEETLPVATRQSELNRWRQDLQRAYSNHEPSIPVIQELKPVIHTYKLPALHFEEIIQGVEMDLSVTRYASFNELDTYCYRVASAVGLLSIEIFGYQDRERCREYAIHLGKALQLTNILRDIRNDAERGRVYVPTSALQQFGVTEKQILENQFSPNFRSLASSLAERATGFYRNAHQTLPTQDRRSMVAAELMGAVYWNLLRKIERANFNVLTPSPIKLPKRDKVLLALRTWLRMAFHPQRPNYGW